MILGLQIQAVVLPKVYGKIINNTTGHYDYDTNTTIK